MSLALSTSSDICVLRQSTAIRLRSCAIAKPIRKGFPYKNRDGLLLHINPFPDLDKRMPNIATAKWFFLFLLNLLYPKAVRLFSDDDTDNGTYYCSIESINCFEMKSVPP